ncbi:hypothetical protein E2C01_081219 [Portunus trituberculatus]|nr:hypothetical protein [Portunus trituberculatus]
MVPLYHGGPFS